jgi:hypothetical protein
MLLKNLFYLKGIAMKKLLLVLVFTPFCVFGKAEPSLQDQLFEAVAKHEQIKVENLIKKKKVSPNIRDAQGNTPLFYAKHLAMVKILVENGADINAQNEGGLARLHMDVFKGHQNIISYLLRHGANVNLATQQGTTPLHFATAISYFVNPKKAEGALQGKVSDTKVENALGAGIAGITGIALVTGIAQGVMAKSPQRIAEEGAKGSGHIVVKKTARRLLSGKKTKSLKTATENLTKAEKEYTQALKTGKGLRRALAKFKQAQEEFSAAQEAVQTAAAEGELGTPVAGVGQEASMLGELEEVGVAGEAAGEGISVVSIAAPAAVIAANIALAMAAIDIQTRNNIVDWLLDKGANPNAQDDGGNAPLHILSAGSVLKPEHRHGGVIMAEHLILRGARRDITNNAKQTPYDVAAQYNRKLLEAVLNSTKKRPIEKGIKAIENWHPF